MTKQRSKRGFTLIELLVVISIIALLIAILLPALQKAREASEVALCGSRQKQIAVAQMLYTEDFKGWFPTHLQGYEASTLAYPAGWHIPFNMNWGDPNSEAVPTGYPPKVLLVNPYVNLPILASAGGPEIFELFSCPGDKGSNQYNVYDPTCVTPGTPARRYDSNYWGSSYHHGLFHYNQNFTFIDHNGVVAPAYTAGAAYNLLYTKAQSGVFNRKESDVKQPARKVIVSGPTEYYASGTWGCEWGGYRAFHDKKEPFFNMAFVDGHVAYHNLAQGMENDDFTFLYTD